MIILTPTIPGKAAIFAVCFTPGGKPPIPGDEFQLIV